MDEKEERLSSEEADVKKDEYKTAAPPGFDSSFETEAPESEPAEIGDGSPDISGDINDSECIEHGTDSSSVFKKLGAALDSLEAKLEKPVIPLWARYKELSPSKKFLAAVVAFMIASGLVFLCFLPGILRTVEKNKAAETAALQAFEEAEAERLAEEAAKAAADEKVYQAKAKVNEYKHNILTDFYASEYSIQLRTCDMVISHSELSGLYTLVETAKSYHFVPDRELIREYLTKLCEETEPDPSAIKYCNVAQTRDDVYCSEYDMGFTPDIDKAADDLALLIALGQGGVLEMEYYGSSYCETIWNKVDGTCIEISLDNQYLWLYHDGKIAVETPIVSGNLSTGDRTPSGKFFIYWITTDTYLKGATWYDYVSHWAPFYGNYGIHDAQWRTEFGGDIYKTDGSHGCINVPIEAMNKIAAYYYIKMPVIIY